VLVELVAAGEAADPESGHTGSLAEGPTVTFSLPRPL
jgi:hypothetical protein